MNFRTVTAVFAVWLSIIAMHAYGWIHLKEDLLTRFLFDPVYAEFMLGAVLAYVVRKRNWQHGGAWIALGALMFPFAWLIRYDAPSLNYSNVYYTIGSSLALFGVSTINPKKCPMVRTAQLRWRRVVFRPADKPPLSVYYAQIKQGSSSR